MTSINQMPRYRATELRANNLPWFCWDTTEGNGTRPMQWGVTLVPTPDDPKKPTYWEWSAMLPEGTTLPTWIKKQ
jgi:hypothetical protein